MKNYAMMALGLALLPTLAVAAPEFSGTWARDNARSTPAGYPTYWLARTTQGGFGGNQEAIMRVQQSGATLQVADPVRPVRTYALDGVAHTVTADTGLTKTSVTARLQGDEVVIDKVEPYSEMPGSVTAKIRETWRLSPDGKELTITTTRDVPAKQQSYKEVYLRK